MIIPGRTRIPTQPRAVDPTHSTDRRAILIRARFLGVLIGLLFAMLTARLYYLQLTPASDEFRQAADANEARLIRSRAPRGTIEDINGTVLATNRSRYAVYATPDVLKNAVVLNRLAGLLDETPREITQDIKDAQQNPYDPLRVALDVPMSTVTKIEESRPFLPGVSTEPEPVRWYPYGSMAAHLLGTMGRINEQEFKDPIGKMARPLLSRISADDLRDKTAGRGYFSDDFVGKTGVEREYEPFLHGTPGGKNVQIDARGRLVKTLGTKDAIPGSTVVLSLDERVQRAAEKVFATHKFTGAAVAIDPRTGAILAMVSEPSFDPDAFSTGIKAADWKPLNTSKEHPFINRSVDAMYPPGSTFKPIVAAAGLQTGAINTHSTAYCTGSYQLGRRRFHCWQVHGEVDFFEAMAKSCDVFFYIAGQAIGPEHMSQYAKNFGLAERTGVDLPDEYLGTIPSPEWKARHFRRLGSDYSRWAGGDTLNMAIGQGFVLTTPLQMARVCATVANGGDVLQPYVVDHVTDADGAVLYTNTRNVVRHVSVDAKNMEFVRQAMRDTVTNGTGHSVDFDKVAVAAKTGSAQVHGQAKTHGWFICFAPYDHPTIAIASVVEHGGHGADSAGRVARAMLETYFHLPITPDEPVKSD